jgi:hypothetical protein
MGRTSFMQELKGLATGSKATISPALQECDHSGDHAPEGPKARASQAEGPVRLYACEHGRRCP